MSLILDALRRKAGHAEDGSELDTNPRSDAVLATLGYPRHSDERGSALKLVVGGLTALTAGFAGIALLIYFFAPERQVTRTASVSLSPPTPAPLPSRSTPKRSQDGRSGHRPPSSGRSDA